MPRVLETIVPLPRIGFRILDWIDRWMVQSESDDGRDVTMKSSDQEADGVKTNSKTPIAVPPSSTRQ